MSIYVIYEKNKWIRFYIFIIPFTLHCPFPRRTVCYITSVILRYHVNLLQHAITLKIYIIYTIIDFNEIPEKMLFTEGAILW